MIDGQRVTRHHLGGDPDPRVAAVDHGASIGDLGRAVYVRDAAAGKIRVLVDMQRLPGPTFGAYWHARREREREPLTRFARVLQQAAIYTNAHTTENVQLLTAWTGLEPEVAAKMHHAFVGTSFDASLIQPVIDLAVKYKTIPARFDARDMIGITTPR